MLDPELYAYEVLAGTVTFTADDRAWCVEQGRRIKKISVSLTDDVNGTVTVSVPRGDFATTTIVLFAGESLCLEPDGAGLYTLFIEVTIDEGEVDWVIESWKKV